MYHRPTNTSDRFIAALSNAGRKNIRIQQQYFYLMKSKQQSTIPKGIFEQCQFQCSVKDPVLEKLTASMMIFTASRILDILILYYHNWSNRLRENYYKLENEFKTAVPTNHFERGMATVQHKIRQQKLECEKTHDSKLNRDKVNGTEVYIKNSYTSLPEQPEVPRISLTKTRTRRRKEKKSKVTKPRKRKSVHKHRRDGIKSRPLNRNNISQAALDKTVINLSSKTVTNAHKFVFHLGESFAVTPSKTNRDKLVEDVNSWANSLRMSFVLSRVVIPTQNVEEHEKTLDQKVKQMEKDLGIKTSKKKNFSNSGNHALELFISNVKKQISNHPRKPKPAPRNVDKETTKAIQELKSWDDAVIRLFDKGTGFFVLDKSDYINRVEAALKDQSTFRQVSDQQQQIHTTIITIKEWVLKYSVDPDCPGMTLNFMEWVTPSEEENEPGVNYMNLKAHKPEKNYPGRLISTGCNSYIKNLSIFTAEELKKVTLPHCLMDSNDLLMKMKELNESGRLTGKTIYHVTFDIVNMFPSISKEIGIPACRTLLDQRGTKLFSTDCVMEALEVTLDNNITVFNGNMYVQTSGTAMGPNNACQYADSALSPLDSKIMECQEITTPEFYGRYRDDIYITWTESLEKLDQFLLWLNQYHPKLKFTMSTPSTEGTEFLDLFIYSKNGKLETRTYCKPSDAHSYLLPQSCHPTHIAENIPYGVAHRVFKNCSEEEEYLKCKIEFSKYLEDRNYNKDLIHKSFEKVELLKRDNMISKNLSSSNSKNSERCFPLVCDFDPNLPPIGKIVNKNKFILGLDPLLKSVIHPSKVFVSYRGNKTIKETLVPSKLSEDRKYHEDSNVMALNSTTENVALPTNIEEGGCYHCNSRCKACRLYICESKTAQGYHSGYTVNIIGQLDCNTVGVCYLVKDKVCRRASVGSTVNNFKTRWQNHKSHIRKAVRSCEISCHLNDNQFHNLTKEPLKTFDNELSDQIEVIIFEKLDFSKCLTLEDRSRVAKERESFWQNQLMTLSDFGGLNKRSALNEIKN